MRKFDIVCFSECKLDDSIPNSFYNNSHYTKIRLDRNRHGGGLMIFIKNGIKKTRIVFHNNLELIYFQFLVNSEKLNFVYCYRPPTLNEIKFLDELEDFIHTLNLNEPLFVFGDLNMNCLNDENLNIKRFMQENELINFMSRPTRNCSKFYKKTNETKKSSTLIDIFLHNGDMVEEANSIECPFSDHSFLLASLTIKKVKIKSKMIKCRNLTAANLEKISNQIDSFDWKAIKDYKTVEEKWCFVRESMKNIIDLISPIREISIKMHNHFPWYDEELIILRHTRDEAYKVYKRSNLETDKELFQYYKKQFEALNNEKLVNFFKDKTINDFKDSKKFWKFYSSLINIESDKQNEESSIILKIDNKSIDNRQEIGNIFNRFFTSISSSSDSTFDESIGFIDRVFERSKIRQNSSFKFNLTNGKEIDDILQDLSNTSGPGVCGIPIKCFKKSSSKFKSIIAYLFNFSILTNSIPKDWKTALVTPLFKNKGSREDPNNYRGISVLPPIAKLFEKLLHKQITSFISLNKILSGDQHGFRSNHSCESALHEIISEMNDIKSKRLIGFFLFIDFKKAFDSVDQRLLLYKLRKYGFEIKKITLFLVVFLVRPIFY
ncbi:unnamed protein product [Brachionus calyciflorus]|uniref:Reverse transcriptase domain-containing protein n=1 Tax=Brachionus calyciflorus TaxID=104777 RepID=A0A814MWY7_9BILA|nr:unnamed protein product [Brachionus calyciflorus]